MTDTKISGLVSCSPDTNQKVHDLVMLYLNNQDLTDISIDNLAKKYIDVTKQLNSSLNDYRKSLKNIL